MTELPVEKGSVAALLQSTPAAIHRAAEMLTKEQLVALVMKFEGLVRTQAQTIAEIANERDAARLLNELCHFDGPLLLEERFPRGAE